MKNVLNFMATSKEQDSQEKVNLEDYSLQVLEKIIIEEARIICTEHFSIIEHQKDEEAINDILDGDAGSIFTEISKSIG